MLDTKALIAKLLSRVIASKSVNYSMTSKSAGARGYFNVHFNDLPATYSPVIVRTTTSSISATSGMQLTPVYMTNGDVYVHYYFPAALSTTVTINVTLFYMGGGTP